MPRTRATARLHWVGDGERHSVRELASCDLRSIQTIPLSDFPYRIVAGPSAVWVASGFRGTVEQIDAENGTSREFRPEPRSTGRVQLREAYGSLWAASQDGILARLDVRSLKALALIPRIGSPETLRAGLGSVWV
jgi:hypothetical protein